MRIISIFLAAIFIIIGCKKEEEKPTNNKGPEINISSPTSQDMPVPGSLVEISANITDNDEIHDVEIYITNNGEGDEYEMEFDHIHNTIFNVDTSFIVNIPSGSMADYTIEIIAKDMLENSNSESVTFHVMD